MLFRPRRHVANVFRLCLNDKDTCTSKQELIGLDNMTESDRLFLRKLIRENQIPSPVLELGSGHPEHSARKLILEAGLLFTGTDIFPGSSVDFVANFEREEELKVFEDVAPFGTVLVLNVLEHTFDPVAVLDNALSLVRRGGKLVVITPVVWTLHSFPIDTFRLNPDWYEEYAKRRGLVLDPAMFVYLGHGKVGAFRDQDRAYALPPPTNSRFKYWYSRLVHRTLNTFGRGMAFPSHVAIGAVFVR